MSAITGLQAQVNRRGDGQGTSGASATTGQQYGCIRRLGTSIPITPAIPFDFSTVTGVVSNGPNWQDVAFTDSEYDPDSLSYLGGIKIKVKGRYKITVELLAQGSGGSWDFKNRFHLFINLIKNGSVDPTDGHGIAYMGSLYDFHFPGFLDGAGLVTWQDLNVDDVLTVQCCIYMSLGAGGTIQCVDESSLSVLLIEAL